MLVWILPYAYQLKASMNNSMFPCPALSSETKAARASSAIEAGPQTTTASEPLRPLAASRIEAATSGRLRVIALLESPFSSSVAPVTYLKRINRAQQNDSHQGTYASKVRRPVSKADFNSLSMIEFMYVLVLLHVQTRFTRA